MEQIKYFFIDYARHFLYAFLLAFFVGGVIILWNVTAYRDIEHLKNDAPSFIEKRGFTITSYDGYKGSIIHGGYTRYQARDKEGLLYNMAIGEWRGELMLYNQTCLNAVSISGK